MKTSTLIKTLAALLGAALSVQQARADIADSIVAGAVTNCAIIENGELRCWGSNSAGMLGSNQRGDQLSQSLFPTTVVDGSGRPLRDVIAVSIGLLSEGADSHVCAITADQGQVLCWGRNQYNHLQVGSHDTAILHARPVLRQGQPLTGFVRVAAGERFTCAANVDGEVLCWGFKGPWLGDGNVEHGNGTEVVAPAHVRGPGGIGRLGDVASLVAGTAHVCARQLSGKVWCWGNDDEEQLGNGHGDNRSAVPVPLLGAGVAGSLHQVARISAGAQHTCVSAKASAQSNIQLFCWGRNHHGQLGVKLPEQARVGRPTVVRRNSGVLEGAVRVSAGSDHSCAITGGGVVPTAVYCWGRNQGGRLGANATGENSHIAIEVPESAGGAPMVQVSEIAAAGRHGCVRTSSGGVRCWGDNSQSQLGRFLGNSVWYTTVAGPNAFVHQLDGIAGPLDRVFASGWQQAGR